MTIDETLLLAQQLLNARIGRADAVRNCRPDLVGVAEALEKEASCLFGMVPFLDEPHARRAEGEAQACQEQAEVLRGLVALVPCTPAAVAAE